MALEVQTHQHKQHQYHVDGTRGTASGSSLATLHQAIPVTLDLFHSFSLPRHYIELEEPCPLPSGWQKFLDLKTGEIYYAKNIEKMSQKNGNGPKLELKLNLSPPRASPRVESPDRSATVSPTSPPSSCVSSEMNQEDRTSLPYSNSPEAASMVLVGCPRCLMYVMLSENDPKCPKCKSTVLLDVLHDNNTAMTRKS